ncbi:MAG: glycosyltransferase [Anaerolineae bacterium]|nr:glycosyltransferase [Gemmatimonadaceae bacterium]
MNSPASVRQRGRNDLVVPVPLSILHVLAPGQVGGLESVVAMLASGQARAGHSVSVAAVVTGEYSAEPWLTSLRSAGVHTFAILAPGRAYRTERAAIRELCRDSTMSIVHTHGYRPDVIDAAVARKLQIPTVTTVHGFTGGGFRNRLYERLQLRAFQSFGAVVSVSRPLADELVRRGVGRDKVHIVPNAYDGAVARLPRNEARRIMQVREGSFHIGWVGRLSEEKGADLLLRAVASLGDLPLQVSIVGDGSEREALERQAAKLNIAHRISWRGTVHDAARLFSAFDLFVLSSRTEGTPIVLFEAMAASVPIVATRVGGVPDVLTDSEAMLVPPNDPDSLAGAIRAAHEQPVATDLLAKNARSRLLDQFSVPPWLARYESIYTSLRNSSPGVPRSRRATSKT